MAPRIPARTRSALGHLGAFVGLCAVVLAIVLQAQGEVAETQREVEVRFEDRVDLAARNVRAHLQDLADRQRAYGRRQLSASAPDPAAFEAAVVSFGFRAAVLLDDQGRVLEVAPAKPELLGTELASRYVHLSSAVAGREAVSDVVLSAAEGRPIVAVAVPFDTDTGRRVISGGYDLAESPLEAFLASTATVRGRQAHLVDGAGALVATTEPAAAATLAEQAPILAEVDRGRRTVDHDGEGHVVVVAPVAGTSWRIVASVPTAVLHVQDRPSSTYLLAGASAVLAVVVLLLLRRGERQRRVLERLTRTDPLTGVANRQAAQEALDRVAASSARRGAPWAVAMVDVDRFKAVNDRLGHPAGDEVLRHVAARLAAATRRSELLARWGGEEFLVVMEDADEAAALAAGERLAAAIRSEPAPGGVRVTVSIGTAAATGGEPHRLVSEADAALYEAKAAGRDRVVPATPTDVALLLGD